MKKILLIFIALLSITLSVTGCNAETNVNDNQSVETSKDLYSTIIMKIDNSFMTVNGVETEIDRGMGTSPIIVNKRTLVPIRAIIENMGGKVEWDNDSQKITLYSGNDVINMTVNSKLAYLNGEEKTLDVPPVVINSRTYLPIRFISDGFGYLIDWDNSSQTITITNQNDADTGVQSEQNEVSKEDENNMININIKIGNETFAAKLYDNKTTQELVNNFPMTCNMSELHGNEKYYYMPNSLPTQSETPSKLNKGEIMIYGSDCLVIFYDSFPNSYSYTRLGYIEDTTGLEKAVGKGSVNVTFEVVK